MKPPRIILDTSSALVVAVNSKGGRVEGMRRFANQVLRRGPAFASLADLREIGLASDDAGGWPRMRELFPWLWSDPLLFIGRAANEGQS